MCDFLDVELASTTGIPLQNQVYKTYTGDYTAYTDNNPGVMTNNYPWIITPHYISINGIMQPVSGEFTIYHKNFGRFLDAYNSQSEDWGVVTRIGITDSRIWIFLDPTTSKPVNNIQNGDYIIQQKSTGRNIDAHADSHSQTAVTRTGISPTRIWTINSFNSEPDTFTIKQKSSNRYLTAQGNLLTTLKVLNSGFLSGLIQLKSGDKNFNNYMCQQSYDDLYNGVISKDCCGTPVSIQPDNVYSWINSIKNFPCVSTIPIKSNYSVTTLRTNINQPNNFPASINFNYNVNKTDYGSCLSNWSEVLNDTQRIPCDPYAWFPDPENIGQYRQIPIPTQTYNQCLQYQNTYINTPNKNVTTGQPICPISIKSIPGATGFNPSSSSIDISALDYCLCNCKNFGISDSDCENICKSDPALSNYNDATDVWTRGFFYDSDSKTCKATTPSVQNGEFLSMAGCNAIVNKSIGPPSGGGSSGGGVTPLPTPTPNMKYYIYGFSALIILLLLVGIIVDIKRLF